MVLHSARSKLTQYGFYHLWVNHSERYAHEKFTFLHTSGIERTWRSLKTMFNPLKYVQRPRIINEYAHAYTLRKICKTERLYDAALRCMYVYYFDNYKRFLALRNFEEAYAPCIAHIQFTVEALEQ